MPIRLRLTLAFAVAMAVVLAAMGTFVYLRVQSSLNGSIEQSLRSRADDIAALSGQSDSGLSEATGGRLTEQGESFAQILDNRGRVVDTTPQLGRTPLLTPDEAARAARGTLVLDRPPSGAIRDPFRVLATPVRAQNGTLVVVVGATLEPRDEALSQLFAELAIGGGLALVLASAAGYLLAGAALRPVDSMRRQAAAISGTDFQTRLPLPKAQDEVRRLGETLNDMLDRLAAALRRERRFVADASHELRTPLALLKTELELALTRDRSKGELQDALRSAASETDRLTQLAEDLLVLARADQGTLPLRRMQIPAGQVLEDVAERFRLRASQEGRTLTVQAEAGLVLDADRLRVEQALGNLVENALRHGNGAVTLRAYAEDGAVGLHVLDEGRGFPNELLPHAFERFTRADEARSGGGAGLGLAISRVIAEAHGGTAHAENRAGGTTDVWIRLPARKTQTPSQGA